MAGAIEKEHQAKILFETANLISLEDPAPGLEFMAKQERRRVKRFEKKEVQRARLA